MYDKLPEASDDENDMLDLAFGLTETYILMIFKTNHVLDLV